MRIYWLPKTHLKFMELLQIIIRKFLLIWMSMYVSIMQFIALLNN